MSPCRFVRSRHFSVHGLHLPGYRLSSLTWNAFSVAQALKLSLPMVSQWHSRNEGLIEGLQPPTCSDMPAHVKLPKTNLKATCFTGSAKVRKALQRALDDKNVDEGKAKILGIIADQVISSVAVEVFSIHNSEAASLRYSLVLI
jgi:hypothetical protein